jgi:hypothetical protein
VALYTSQMTRPFPSQPDIGNETNKFCELMALKLTLHLAQKRP